MNLRPWGRGTVPNPPNPDATIAEPHDDGGSRSSVITTDGQLQTGHEPAHIDRIKRAMNKGYTGPHGVNDFAQGDANRRYVGHVPLVHAVKGPTPDYRVTVDDAAYVPAFMAGNPVESPV